MWPVPRRSSEASTARAIARGASPGLSALLPTLVAITMSLRLRRPRIQLPIMVSLRPRGVRVGGVDEVAAMGDVGVEDVVGRGVIGGPAEHVAAHRDREHVEVGHADVSLADRRRGRNLASCLPPQGDLRIFGAARNPGATYPNRYRTVLDGAMTNEASPIATTEALGVARDRAACSVSCRSPCCGR